MRYQQNSLRNRRVLVREIYHMEQLRSFLTNCEKKTQSEGNLNLFNKEFLVDDDEENRNFYVEVDVRENDNEEVVDFLNFQISKEKQNSKPARAESVEELKDDLIYLQTDFVHYNFSEIPELQRRIGNLLHGSIDRYTISTFTLTVLSNIVETNVDHSTLDTSSR